MDGAKHALQMWLKMISALFIIYSILLFNPEDEIKADKKSMWEMRIVHSVETFFWDTVYRFLCTSPKICQCNANVNTKL